MIAGELPAAANENPGDNLAGLLRDLKLSDDAAELRQLLELCRRSVRVRAWLFGRFASEPATREAFRSLLNGDGSGLAQLWSPPVQQQVLTPPIDGPETGRHGGLAESRILTLIKRYQTERTDVATFLLVRCWLRVFESGQTDAPVALWRPTLAHWAAVTRDPSGRLARYLMNAICFFHERAGRRIGEADFGFTNSWRIHVLVYILEHPQAWYRVGELRDHLPEKYRQVGRKEIREFCKKHGIRRDVRPGERRAVPTRAAAGGVSSREVSR